MQQRLLFGFLPDCCPGPLAPNRADFQYSAEELSSQSVPTDSHLAYSVAPEPPPGFNYSLAPVSSYTLVEDIRYMRGYTYTACYDPAQCEVHREHLISITTPPNFQAKYANGCYTAKPIHGMIQTVAGVPFVVNIKSHTQTIACVQTLKSLQYYTDYNLTLAACVRLAKLTWGCNATDTSLEIQPIYKHEGLKLNDRSSARDSMHHDLYDGSFSLANTILKGDGPGTFLLAVQTNLSPASSQIQTVLETLHELRQCVFPKCVSKFKHDITEFHSEYNNVFSFGGLKPNGSSVQMNASSLGKLLDIAIGGIQGKWHTDPHDDFAAWTLFTLLLRVGPSKHIYSLLSHSDTL